MIAVPSSDFLKEFTLFADQANDENETFVIQRANSKNVVMLSLDEFNRMQKLLFQSRQKLK
jgi:antitoxin YefM